MNSIMHFKVSNFVAFFFFMCLASSCHVANDSPEKESILTDTTAEPQTSATILNFTSFLDQQNLSENDKRSLSWIVTLLTQDETFKEFKEACSDNSSQKDPQDCLKLAKHLIYDMHIVFKKTPPLFKKPR